MTFKVARHFLFFLGQLSVTRRIMELLDRFVRAVDQGSRGV